MVQPLVFPILRCFSENTNGKKKFPPGRGVSFPLWGSIAPIPHLYKNYLTFAIINNCFEFKNDWIKTIRSR